MNMEVKRDLTPTGNERSSAPLTVLSAPGQSLCEALGLPPETRLIDSGICSAMTIKRGRRVLEVRHG